MPNYEFTWIDNWSRGHKKISCSKAEHEFFLLIDVKMPTNVGILTCVSMKNSIIGLSEPKKCCFILMNITNFMLSCVEQEKFCITSGPDFRLVRYRTFAAEYTEVI